jgi:hypothetical protein
VYFYVDESGHTGANLFDSAQPVLYYGVLSAKVNLDVLAEPEIQRARSKRGAARLHANELGVAGLAEISNHLIAIQERYEPRFDIYRVVKPDHAVICFFDQVFDQGMNPAMTWTGYWTPMRYVLLVKLAHLFDHELAQRAWKARIDTNDATAEAALVGVCEELLRRIDILPDARSRQVIGDTLRWAALHPGELRYNCKSAEDIRSVTPNLIGFQTVMHGIASRLRSPKSAAYITVDQQSQFNKSQRSLAEFYSSARGIPWKNGPGLPVMDLSKMPTAPITFRSSTESVGLELVDSYLWILKRVLEDKPLAPELAPLIRKIFRRARTDEVSLQAITTRWTKWHNELPDPTPDQLKTAQKIIAEDEARRQQAMRPPL